MKSFWWLVLAAAAVDLVFWPLVWGRGTFIKTVWAISPFAFLFLPPRDVKVFFVLVLIYMRAVTPANLGVLFLSLLIFLYFERWFLITFFHVTAWQTLILSALGIPMFYLAVASFSYLGGVEGWGISPSLILAVVSSALLSIAANFLFSGLYKLK